MDVDADIRTGHRDIRACSGLLAKLIHDGILHLIGDEAGVAEIIRIDYGID